MTELVRIGGVARLDPEAGAEIRMWREDLERGEIDDPEATRARLEDHARGEAMVVRLDLFADLLLADGTIERCDGAGISGLWFYAGRDRENLEHAREMVVDNLDVLRADLQAHGISVDLDALHRSPVRVEVDDPLERELGGR